MRCPEFLRYSSRAALCVSLLVVAVFAQVADLPVQTGKVLELEFHSAALEGNLLGDPPRQKLQVYVPPSYETEPGRRYAAIYLLHPFAGSSHTWTRPGIFGPVTVQQTLDALIAEGAIPEIIVVMPNATNAYGGSMYHNSVVTGRWEDYIADDLVAFVDENLRTVAAPAGRAIAGHSMGGFGSLLLAMTRPDVFSAVYAMSPPVLDFVDLLEHPAAWRRLLEYRSPDEVREAYFKKGDFPAAVLLAVSAAFSPNPENQPFRVDFPYSLRDGELVRNEDAHARWRRAVLVARVPNHRDELSRLKGIWIDYGDAEIELIQSGSQRFGTALAQFGISHDVEAYPGDHHSGIAERLRTRVFPILSALLERSAR